MMFSKIAALLSPTVVGNSWCCCLLAAAEAAVAVVFACFDGLDVVAPRTLLQSRVARSPKRLRAAGVDDVAGRRGVPPLAPPMAPKPAAVADAGGALSCWSVGKAPSELRKLNDNDGFDIIFR